MQVKFPKDIKDSMKDCLLSIFWKKNDIIDFLKNNSCTGNDLKNVQNTDELSRAKIISSVFENLNNRTDGGLGQYRSMLDSLSKWSYFDPYYFHELKKLDLSDAKLKIANLKKLQEIRDGKIKREKREREIREKSINKKSDSTKIRKIYLNLLQRKDEDGKVIGNQKRGYLFEEFLQELFAQENLIKTSKFSFNIEGEQIDGTIKFEGENYIIEAKWHDVQIASNHLYNFSYKVEGKLHGRGLFISFNGFSLESVKALKTGKALKTILIDGEDLIHIVEGRITFKTLLDKKIIAAQTKGEIYYDVFNMRSKMN